MDTKQINRVVRQKLVTIDAAGSTTNTITSQTYHLVAKGYLPVTYKLDKQNDPAKGTRATLRIECVYVGKRVARNWLLCHALRKEYNANRNIHFTIK